MFTATETAVKNLQNYLEANNMQAGIRITCRQGKKLKPGLGLVIGTANKSDQTFEQKGVQFIISQEILDKSGGITLDYVAQGPEKGYLLKPSDPSAACSH